MNSKEIFIEKFNQYLMKRHDYKYRPINAKYVRNTISAYKKKFDIYLRLPLKGNETLVIARIFFQNEKVGHGTSLLKFLAEQSYYGEYKYISIEMVNENSIAFAKKLGFRKINEKDLIIDIKTLRENIKKN